MAESGAEAIRRGAAGRIRVSLDPKGQSLDRINDIVKQLAGIGGCDNCGRLAFIDLGFLGDPVDQRLAGKGVIAIEKIGF